jgi:hypothetical protein
MEDASTSFGRIPRNLCYANQFANGCIHSCYFTVYHTIFHGATSVYGRTYVYRFQRGIIEEITEMKGVEYDDKPAET